MASSLLIHTKNYYQTFRCPMPNPPDPNCPVQLLGVFNMYSMILTYYYLYEIFWGGMPNVRIHGVLVIGYFRTMARMPRGALQHDLPP